MSKIKAKMLKPGSKGPDVETLQKILIGSGAKIGADGIYGKNTSKAVKDFQKKNKLEADGIAGPNTLEALNKISGSAAKKGEKIVEKQQQKEEKKSGGGTGGKKAAGGGGGAGKKAAGGKAPEDKPKKLPPKTEKFLKTFDPKRPENYIKESAKLARDFLDKWNAAMEEAKALPESSEKKKLTKEVDNLWTVFDKAKSDRTKIMKEIGSVWEQYEQQIMAGDPEGDKGIKKLEPLVKKEKAIKDESEIAKKVLPKTAKKIADAAKKAPA